MTFEYEAQLHHWINRVSFLIRAEMQDRLKAEGQVISVEEWAMLMILWADGPTAMSTLASKSLRDRTTVTRLIDRLVQKRLVVRHSGENDRRQVVVEASHQSQKIRPAITGIARNLIATSLAGIPEKDVAVTLNTLKQLGKNLTK